jgi:hypothetical protein
VKTELVITASSNIPVRRKALEVFLISLNFFEKFRRTQNSRGACGICLDSIKIEPSFS